VLGWMRAGTISVSVMPLAKPPNLRPFFPPICGARRKSSIILEKTWEPDWEPFVMFWALRDAIK
jgi:hypothetical protein